MKRPFAILMLSFCTVLAALAQVPERTFKVDVHDTAVVDVPLRSGDRVDLVWRLTQSGTNWCPASVEARYQAANAEGDDWWPAPASVSSNEVRVSWTPTLDPGYSPIFLLVRLGGSVWRCAALLRILRAPGDTPNALPLPAREIDFARVIVTNAPWALAGEASGTDGEAVTNIVRAIVADGAARVPPYMWPGDWFIRIEGAIPGAPAGTYLMPTNDMLARMTGASGVWRSYRLYAEPDSVAASYGDPVPPVEFSYRDPFGAVAAFTNDTLISSGVAGVVHVSAADTNGVVREAAVVMTPVQPGRIANLYASETNVTERYLWAANLFAKLAAVSTAEADLVANPLCRSFAERYEAWKYTTWKSARQLSRFGSDGRIRTNEWAGAMINSSTWADLATPTTARAWAFKQNRDFFWPALQTNLWCFSSACHEGHAAPPALGKDSNGNSINGYRSVPLMAVAPHYAVGAAHYGDWVLSPWQCHPRFVKSTNDNDYVLSHIGGAVGTVTYARGNDSDIRLYRLKQAVPDQCIAHFATREVLQSLSPTLFKYVPCLTVNAHQVVTPYCLGGTGSTLYGWKAEPRTSTFTSPYPDGIDVPEQAADCVHMGHMYDSGDVFFLAAPNGRVVPIGQTKYLNDGGGLSGPSYLDDGVLESLSALIRSDSNGTEDIRYWTAADLYAGGVTNLVEDTP